MHKKNVQKERVDKTNNTDKSAISQQTNTVTRQELSCLISPSRQGKDNENMHNFI